MEHNEDTQTRIAPSETTSRPNGERRAHRHLREAIQSAGLHAELTAEGELIVSGASGTARVPVPASLRPSAKGTAHERAAAVLLRVFSDAAKYELLCGGRGEGDALRRFAARWNQERPLIEAISATDKKASADLIASAMRDLGMEQVADARRSTRPQAADGEQSSARRALDLAGRPDRPQTSAENGAQNLLARVRRLPCKQGLDVGVLLDVGSLIDAATEMLRQRGGVNDAVRLVRDENGLRIEIPDADRLFGQEPLDRKVFAAVNAHLKSAYVPKDLPEMEVTIPADAPLFRGAITLHKIREDARRDVVRHEGTIVDLLLAHDADGDRVLMDLPTKWHYEAMTRFIEDNETRIAPKDFRRMLDEIGHVPGGYANGFKFKREYLDLLSVHASRILDEIRTGSRPDASWREIGEEIVGGLVAQMETQSRRSRSESGRAR